MRGAVPCGPRIELAKTARVTDCNKGRCDARIGASMKITFYLDVTSSWCFWAQPAWEELRERFTERVEFEWKIALMDALGLPPSAEHVAWYYRRSGTIMRSPVMLSYGWYKQGLAEYLAPNAV